MKNFKTISMILLLCILTLGTGCSILNDDPSKIVAVEVVSNVLNFEIVGSTANIHREVHTLPLASRLIFKLVNPFFLNVEDGAKTSLYVSSSDELSEVSGKYFYKEKVCKSSKLSYSKDLQELLWKKSEGLVPLDRVDF